MHNCGNFHLYNISGCKVKKFEMFSWRWSIHEMAHFWAFLGPNSLKCDPILLKFTPQLVFMGSKKLFEESFENSNFYRNRTYPKFAVFFSFCPTLRPFFSMKEANIEKTKYAKEKTTSSGYPKIAKSRTYLVSIFQEKYDYILSYFGRFFVKMGRGHTLKAQNQNLTYLLQSHNYGECSSQKSLHPELSSFAAIGAKGCFFSISDHFFKFGCFFRYHTLIFWINEFDFLVPNLILSRLAPV